MSYASKTLRAVGYTASTKLVRRAVSRRDGRENPTRIGIETPQGWRERYLVNIGRNKLHSGAGGWYRPPTLEVLEPQVCDHSTTSEPVHAMDPPLASPAGDDCASVVED